MIVRPRPAAWQLPFLLRGSIVPQIAGKLVVVLVVAMVAGALVDRGPDGAGALAAVPFSLLGLALSVFLAFRNNVCYDRWWEGRRQWGSLIQYSRGLVRQALHAWPAGAEAPRAVARYTVAYAHALAARLRRDDPLPAMRAWVPDGDLDALRTSRNVNNLMARRITALIASARADGTLSDYVAQALLDQLEGCSASQAACERIAGTPAPYAYSLLLHRTAWMFCLLLPFGLTPALGWWAAPVTVAVAYTFFGLDALGDELEDPFGREDNDLPLGALVRSIEIDIRELLDEPPPEPLQPHDHVLR